MKIFGFGGVFHNFMERIFDLVILHFLWLIFSLPIITIGASTSALFSVTLKMVKNEESYIVKSFWQAFKCNLGQSTKLWGIVAGSFAWLMFTMRICIKGDSQVLKILGIPNAGVLFIATIALMYIFPIQAKYENSTINILKNSIICSLQYLPYSILMLSIIFIPIVLTGYVKSFFPIMIVLWMLSGSSLIAFCSSFVLNKIFNRIKVVEQNNSSIVNS